MEKVEKTENGCWIWIPKGNPYGMFFIGKGQHTYSHRAAYILFVGPIPKRMHVCHNCPDGDNPRCVNPGHLWLGTAADNNADCRDKGRFAMGDNHGWRKHPECVPRGDAHWTKRKNPRPKD